MLEKLSSRGTIFHVFLQTIVDEFLPYLADLSIIIELMGTQSDSVSNSLNAIAISFGGKIRRLIEEHHVCKNA